MLLWWISLSFDIQLLTFFLGYWSFCLITMEWVFVEWEKKNQFIGILLWFMSSQGVQLEWRKIILEKNLLESISPPVCLAEAEHELIAILSVQSKSKWLFRDHGNPVPLNIWWNKVIKAMTMTKVHQADWLIPCGLHFMVFITDCSATRSSDAHGSFAS